MKSVKIMLIAIGFMMLIAIEGVSMLIGGGTGYETYLLIAAVLLLVMIIVGFFYKK